MAKRYEIIDHGVDHAQYFGGCGTFGTRFDRTVTGAGCSAKEAGDDALDQFWDTVDKQTFPIEQAEQMHAEIEKMSTRDDAHHACRVEFDRTLKRYKDENERDAAWDKYHETCEMYHYVSIRWKE
jgi:hypothetical protein